MRPDKIKNIKNDLSPQGPLYDETLMNKAVLSQRNQIRIKIKELQEQLREITGIGLDGKDKIA